MQIIYKLIYELIKKYRKYTLFVCDMIVWNVSFYLSFSINKNSLTLIGYETEFLIFLGLANVCFAAVFILFKLYNKIWRYAGIEDLLYVGIANFCANFLFMTLTFLIRHRMRLRVYILFLLVSTLMIFMFRIVYRVSRLIETKIIKNTSIKKRTLIVGAGETTLLLLGEVEKRRDNEYLPICIVDDDRAKIGRTICGVKVEGAIDKIPEICEKYQIEIILFSITMIAPDAKKRIFDVCSKTGLEVRVVPNVYEIMTLGKPITSTIRSVEIKDLLGRAPIIFDKNQYGSYIKNNNILITGGGGSIGSELCRQIASLEPKCLVILDIYENSAYEIEQEIKSVYGTNLNFHVEIGSIRDKNKVDAVFKKHEIDVVFHAAAHKHVPLMENNPEEAVKNNIFGTINLANAADKFKIKKFVQISTDKAVNPTNIMGATKRICEMIVQNMDKMSNTEFVAVRFGNVLGSNGSVIPLFQEQIRNNGPVTVTHPEIIRYFMTIPEAVSLVLTAGGLAKGGEIFVLDMGDPVKIKDLAENLIRLSGYEPDIDIKIEYTGLRPGEKLFEELLLSEEDIKKTENEKIFIAMPIKFDYNLFENNLNKLKEFSEQNDAEGITKVISQIIPCYEQYKLKNLNMAAECDKV